MRNKLTDEEAKKLDQWAGEFAKINGLAAAHDEADDDLHELPARPRQVIPAADRELLELAARALGAMRVEDVDGEQWLNLHFADGATMFHWNPLVHSDDTFVLAVRLGILELAGAELSLSRNQVADEVANARYAVVHIAAEIEKARNK